MGYRIVYGREPALVYRRRKSRLRLWTAVFALVFVAVVHFLWPQGEEMLRRILIPQEQTVAAFSGMVEQIENGQAVGAAVTAFCRRVVADGLAQQG